ncbi:hypothetical protein MLD38_022860 [Melastoma candidum]|uniref:Uncharacterized protein n=1 Tax=Melastoma candidum TaxID=119954 RepID=A0ACB9QJT7_9MYRT|nr:hypothetical protein MLD38_022860 [Melastoma candidum]
MSVPYPQTCTGDSNKKRKRMPKIYDFPTFPAPIQPAGRPFRDNIRLFLQQCALPQDHSLRGMPVWCTLLLHKDTPSAVPLYTVQENVRKLPSPFCDHCRFAGWSSHYLSKRRYHLIIPMDHEWSRPLDLSALDLPNHLLHGMIHANGYGHLLVINGIEGGSRFLCGREIMDLWDRICTNLLVRKITVEDVSRKRGMDLRLLYGVAYGHPWFGRWGYRFHKGSFGNFQEVKQIIRRYQDLSETNLVSLRDLLRLMLTLKSYHSPKVNIAGSDRDLSSLSLKRSTNKPVIKDKPNQKAKQRYRSFAAAADEMGSRWPPRRLEQAAEVIVEALIQNKEEKFGQGGMTRQDVRDVARMHIGDTGLLDNVLKMMNNVTIRNFVVRRSVNPSTRVLEYTINELGNDRTSNQEEQLVEWSRRPPPLVATADDIYHDMSCINEAVLLKYPKGEWMEMACRKVLDSKHFLKEWRFRDEADQLLTFVCNVLPNTDFTENMMVGKVVVGEIVTIPLHSTIGELKLAAGSAFQDTYCGFQNFVVTEIRGMEELEDDELLFGVVESGAQLWMRGIGMDGRSELKHEGGTANWRVMCGCGAEDDDGERMVACDICEVWQHTRCCGIKDTGSVPPLFVCSACCGVVSQTRGDDILEFDNSFEIEPYGCLLLPSSLEMKLEMELQC